MTDDETKIDPDDLDWEHAEVREGRQPASVISVRLDDAETGRLRALADSLGLNVSQVLRRALAAYEPAQENEGAGRAFVTAFTYGGTVPISYEQVWSYQAMQLWPGAEEGRSGGNAPTGTEPIRIVERVTS